MHLRILLPFRVFADQADVVRIIADTHEGSFGFLPHRLDCVASLIPGILMYQTEGKDEVYTAIDKGVLVKFGLEVLISVRNAIAGSDLDHLQAEVQKQFLTLDEQQQSVRSTMAKLETNVVRRLVEMQHD